MGEAPGKDRKRIWYGLLSSALAAGLLYYSLRGVEWARVWTTIIHARGQFLAVAGLTLCCSFFLRSYRWRILLNTDADFDVLTVFIATMAGYLGNAFLPARAGEFVRSYIISKSSSLSKTYVLTTALSERMVDAIALVLASSVVLLSVNPKPAWLGDVSRTTAAIAGVGLLAIALAPHTGDLHRAGAGQFGRAAERQPEARVAGRCEPHHGGDRRRGVTGHRPRATHRGSGRQVAPPDSHAHGTARSPAGTGRPDSTRPADIAQPHAVGGFYVLDRGGLVDRLRYHHGGRSRPRDRLALPGGAAFVGGLGVGKRAALHARIRGNLSIRYRQHPDPVRRQA